MTADLSSAHSPLWARIDPAMVVSWASPPPLGRSYCAPLPQHAENSPPAPAGCAASYRSLGCALRSMPKKWAQIPDRCSAGSALAFVTRVRSSSVVGMEYGFDATRRGRSVWVRYLGDEQ